LSQQYHPGIAGGRLDNAHTPEVAATGEHAILESGELHRLLVERVSDYAIFALDPRGNILTWNAGAERLTGYRPEEAIGKHFSIFYPPEDLAAGKPARDLQIAAKAGRVDDDEWRVRKDGTRFWANVLLAALRDDNGHLIGFAKITRDLSERRRSEKAMRDSEERFRLLVQSVRDYAIFMLDPSGHIATWNDGAERIKSYRAEEIIGKHFSIFYPPEDIAAEKPARELAIAIAEGKYEEEGWRLRKDGSRFWASVLITAVRAPDGHLAGFAKVTRDLSERRAAEERALQNARRLAAEEARRDSAEHSAGELRTLAEQLRAQALELERRSGEAERANRVKSEFLAAMSHELRTPLNAIGGYAQLMELGLGGPVTGEQHEQLRRIQQSQQHLLGIINDLLNFTRLEAGHVQYDIGPVMLADVLQNVAAMIAPQSRAKRLYLEVVECPPEIIGRGDRIKIEQILLNLLSNAVKFTPNGGHVTLSCGEDGDSVWLRVSDTGVGIPADEHETIFAPFVQVGRSLASPKEGTGLGLSISRDLARAMGGDLTVASEERKGATFTLTLRRGDASR
jgi:PAS domain S-box-containing protein